MGIKITKELKQEITVDLEPSDIRLLVFLLDSKDQLGILAAIVNKFERDQYVNLSPSEQMQLKLWLKSMLNTIE